MATRGWNTERATFFYVALAGVAVAAALIGFSTTYFIPLAGARFDGPVVAHIHGLTFFGWIALLVAQTTLARSRKLPVHRTLGLAALPLSLAMAVSGMGVSLYAVQRDLAAGRGEAAYSQIVGVATAMIALVAFVAIALLMRRRPDWHKRMMLLATIAILWPAWFRFRHLLPWVPNPEIWLGLVIPDSLIVVAALRDRFTFGRVHPAYLIFGTALIADHVAETLLYDSVPWRAVARAIYSAIA